MNLFLRYLVYHHYLWSTFLCVHLVDQYVK